MITNCTRCSNLFEARGDEEANEPNRLCTPCHNQPCILQVTLDTQTWFIHQNHQRLNNQQTAQRFNRPDAEMIACYYRKMWQATTQILEV